MKQMKKSKMELHFSYEEKKPVADRAFLVAVLTGLILTAIATVQIVLNISLKYGLIFGVLCTAFIVGSYLVVKFCDKSRGRWR